MSYDVSRALCGQAGYLSGPGISNANIAATLDAGLDSEPEPHRHQGQGDTKNHREVTRNRVRRQAWNAIEHERIIAARNVGNDALVLYGIPNLSPHRSEEHTSEL